MKKISKRIIASFFLIALVVLGVLYFYYDYEDKETSLTAVDRKWLSENKDEIVDFDIINNMPVFGLNGSGVLFDFLNDFASDTELDFNKVPYLAESGTTSTEYRIRVLENGEKITNNDLLIYEDCYVAISTKFIKINDTTDFSSLTIGMLEKDSAEITYYLRPSKDVIFRNYSNSEDMFNDLNNGSISLVIAPYIETLNYTVKSSNYVIDYYFANLSKKVVLSLSETNKKLNEIMTRYYKNWKENYYVETYNDNLLDYYISERVINDKTRTDLLSKIYVYGYVENPPYESTLDDELAGIAGEYISRIKRLTNIDFEFKKYNSFKELKNAIENEEIDIYFDYYDYSNTKFLSTHSTFIERYAILKTKGDNRVITSFEDLKGLNINMIGDNYLYKYFNDNAQINIRTYENIQELIKKSNNDIIVVDKEIYDYYDHTKFKNYDNTYSSYMTNDYKFMVRSDNKTFYDLFNYIITTNSYYNYRTLGLSNMNVSIISRRTFEEVYLIVLASVFIPLIIICTTFFIIKNRNKIKNLKREDRKKYTDLLTSLKNRNYLKLKLPSWEDSKVYPQVIVIIDLNNVKYVNNNYGTESGDKLITKAASILVNTQPENSEIIRTDGNEFLVYMVGYSENQASTYVEKIGKELSELPYGFGAALGFSVILDDIKSIDDAINEATIEMRADKERYK